MILSNKASSKKEEIKLKIGHNGGLHLNKIELHITKFFLLEN